MNLYDRLKRVLRNARSNCRIVYLYWMWRWAVYRRMLREQQLQWRPRANAGQTRTYAVPDTLVTDEELDYLESLNIICDLKSVPRRHLWFREKPRTWQELTQRYAGVADKIAAARSLRDEKRRKEHPYRTKFEDAVQRGAKFGRSLRSTWGVLLTYGWRTVRCSQDVLERFCFMRFTMFSGFVVLWIVGGAAVCFGLIPMWADTWSPLRAQEAAAAGFTDSAEQQALMRQNHMIRAYTPRGIQALWLFWSLLFVWQLIKQQALLNLLDRIGRPASMLLVAALLLCSSGCRRPFEPVQLEVVGTNEEAFLIPLLGDSTKQAQTNSEEYLAKNLVQTKQVLMPQQWVPKGFETFGPHGVWQPAAVLIRVDRSPVTREWTADPMSGTSNRNEAIWVMTSDQVEFSTGWTCTARIPTREAAVKFLYNYPSGSIASVMDREVRAMVQTTFGAEVTDEPMEKLRTQATPHIQQVVKKVTDFFAERGLEITNLGISGGFVYKDAKIQAKLVELFNSEQEKAIATATALALQEAATGKANAVKAEALGESEAAKTRALGEAEAIKTRADAKAYEISKAKEDMQTFMELRRLELMKEQIEKWSGVYPIYYIGTDHPSTLLTLPSPQLKPAGE